jgi:hypothetical protein
MPATEPRPPSRRLGARTVVNAFCALLAIAVALRPLAAQTQTINCTAAGNPCWATGSFDNHRDSHNNNEAILLSTGTTAVCAYNTCANPVQQNAVLAVDGILTGDLPNGQLTNPVYAQPLYVPNIKINGAPSGSKCYNGGTCNLVVASTLNGTLFAWDADTYALIWDRQGTPAVAQGTAGNAFWYNDCKEAGAGPVVSNGGGVPFFGSVSTGVIDFSNTTSSPAVLYLTSACTNTQKSITAAWFLHGIDLLTGKDISGSPVAINAAAISGTATPLNSPCAGDAVGCVSCTGSAGCPSGGYWIKFHDSHQNQKPALLLLTDTNVSQYPMIYVALGAFNEVAEASPTKSSHGWIVRFKTTGGTLQTPTFVANTSNLGPTSNNSSPVCTQGAAPAWYYKRAVNTSSSYTFPLPSNQCGRDGRPWSSTRGIAASNSAGEVNAGVFDIYVGTGNGPYQGGGSAAAQNLGQSLLHFKSSQDSSTAYTAFAPTDYFTPIGQQQWPTGSYLNSSGYLVTPPSENGGNTTQICGAISTGFGAYDGSNIYPGGTPCTPALQPPQVDSGCPCTTGACSGYSAYTFCSTTALVESGADWDQSTSGELLFEDPYDMVWKVVTSSKDGYGHVLNAADLGGAQANDPGDLFTFAAANLLCPDMVPNYAGGPLGLGCDRLTSIAMYTYSSANPACGDIGTCTVLAIWPNDQIDAGAERLRVLQISPLDGNGNWAPQQLTGTFTASDWVQNAGSSGDGTGDGQYYLTGVGTSFGTQVIAGDVIVCGCTVAAGDCPVITKVFSNTSPPYVITASGPPANCAVSGGLEYAGYFINPRPDFTPQPYLTGYPGGSLVVDSSGPTTADGVIWAVIPNNLNWDGNASFDSIRAQGTLYAYNAVPNSSGLKMLWNSTPNTTTGGDCGNCQYFCANSFTLPTVAHGQVFLGTDAILPTGTTLGGPLPPRSTVHCPTDNDANLPPFTSGILVYGQ